MHENCFDNLSYSTMVSQQLIEEWIRIVRALISLLKGYFKNKFGIDKKLFHVYCDVNSLDWFLYDIELRRERVNRSLSIPPENIKKTTGTS